MPFLAGSGASALALSRPRCLRLSERSGEPGQEERALRRNVLGRKGKGGPSRGAIARSYKRGDGEVLDRGRRDL